MKREIVNCGKHDEAYATFVCEHLVKKPNQFWFSKLVTPKNQWPDSWCKQCEAIFQEQGEWNQSNEENIPIELVCDICYSDKKLKSLDAPRGVIKEWNQLLQLSHQELHAKQDRLTEEFDISKHERWDYDQVTGVLEFSSKGKPVVEAKFQVIGSTSKTSNTWMWGWANENITHTVRRGVKAVGEYGIEKKFSRLTIPKYPCDEYTGWQMAGVAAHIMKSKGIYRAPHSTGELFLAIQKIYWVNQ